MNTIKTIHINYLRPSRTIETILVENQQLNQVFFVYNYEGTSYRVFEQHLDLINFFQDKAECDIEFGTEEALDGFLGNLKIKD